MEIFCRRLAPEALQFAKDTLTAGGQPTRVRKLLQDKFESHLISKDLINQKQTLAGVKTIIYFKNQNCERINFFHTPIGNNGDEWKYTVDLLLDLRKDPNNVINVSYDGDAEVAAIFIQLEKQRKLYHKYDIVVEMDGTYKITKIGFSLEMVELPFDDCGQQW